MSRAEPLGGSTGHCVRARFRGAAPGRRAETPDSQPCPSPGVDQLGSLAEGLEKKEFTMEDLKKWLAMMFVSLGIAAGVVVVSGSVISPANAADCNNTVFWHAGYNDRHDNAFNNDYTPQRNGPYDACGQVNYAHAWTDIRLHCAGINDNGVVWAHIRNINYDSGGWVRGASLKARVQDARVQIC